MESRPQGRLFSAFGCAEGAVEFGAPSPPLRGLYLFPLAGKDMEEKGAGDAK
jgi:hypothetical protein